MDDRIAPPALSTREESPAYDLISLGLVTLVILVVGIWVTHFFRQPPPGDEAFRRMQADLDLETSAGQLEAARWAMFNLRSGSFYGANDPFCEHLRKALELEQKEREQEARTAKDATSDDAHRRLTGVDARARLAEDPVGPAMRFATRWAQGHAAEIEAIADSRKRQIRHRELATALRIIGFTGMAEEQEAKARKLWPDDPLLRPPGAPGAHSSGPAK
jgi:hypothetical protein